MNCKSACTHACMERQTLKTPCTHPTQCWKCGVDRLLDADEEEEDASEDQAELPNNQRGVLQQWLAIQSRNFTLAAGGSRLWPDLQRQASFQGFL